jgi:hypothetical protein
MTQKLEVAPLKEEDRRTRIEKARERLRCKKVYQEDNDVAVKPALNLSIDNVSPTKLN